MGNKAVMKNGAFLKLALTTAMPIMIQNVISTLVNSADTIMLGYVSQEAMSASSLANQYSNLLFCAFYGMTAAASVLASQYWGKGDKAAIEKVLGLCIRISMIFSVVAFAVSFSFPGVIMSIFTNDAAIIKEGITYLRIVSFSYLFMGFTQIYLSVLRSVERLVLPSIVYVISLLVNVFINATFIFGFFGLPKLGLVGVSLGTVTARVVEFVICAIDSARSDTTRFKFKYFFGNSGALMGDVLKLAVPSLVNDIAWSAANSAYSVVMGHLGSDVVAANSVAIIAVNVGAIACRGFSNATTIIVSRELGYNNTNAAKIYSIRMLLITLVVSLCGSGVIVAIRPLLVGFYVGKITDAAISLLSTMLLLQTIRLVGEGVNTCLICGCFRGGGDAKFGMILDAVFMWCVAVPLMAGSAFILKLPTVWVYLFMCLDEWYKFPPTIVHYLKFKWMKNITRDDV